MKILQVDAITSGWNQSNVLGLSGAYSKVGELYTFDYRALARAHGESNMNAWLAKLAIEFQPDLIHLEKCELVKPNTVKVMREKTQAKIIQVFGDYRPEVPSYILGTCPFVDWSLRPHHSLKWADQIRKAGCSKVGFWTRGVDPEVFKPHLRAKQYDLIKMGIKVGDPHPGTGQGDRGGLLRALDHAGFQVHLFGQANREFAKSHQNIFDHRFVDLAEFAKVISATKISLAVNTHEVPMYCSWRRVFNTLACGGFLLIRYFPGLEEVFKNKEHLVWFRNTDEAIRLIKYYLEHSEFRNAIGLRGRQEVITHHTWDIRMEGMLSMAFENREPQFGRFPKEEISKKPFLTIVTRVRVNPRYLPRTLKSVEEQTDQDIEHLLIEDHEVVTNMGRANQSLARWKDHVNGQWVYILDDDDLLTYPGFVEGLKQIVKDQNPHVIMVKAMISEVKQKISPLAWGAKSKPIFCQVSTLNFVVRADLWKKYINHFGKPHAGDYHFISELWEMKGLRISWWDQLVAYAPRTGRDQPKEEPKEGPK